MPLTVLSAVFCGSQTIPPAQECLSQLAFRLTHDPILKDLRQAVLELPDLWLRLQERGPLLQQIPDSPLLDLKKWLSGAESALQISTTLPNAVLAPLTVIIHIVQYTQYLETLGLEDAHIHIRETAQHGGFQGLCIGSLSAAALACSGTKTEIGRNAAIAVRLAMCVGAYVDIDRVAMGNSTIACFIARWGLECRREEVEETLRNHPKAYISVELDKTSATITAPEADIPALHRELTSKSVKIANVQLNGRYHSQEHTQLLQSLLTLCSSEPSLYFQQASTPLARWRSNATGAVVADASELATACIQSLLTERANWYSTISETIASFAPVESETASTVLELGLVSCMPPSLSALPHITIVRGSLPTAHTNSPPEKPLSTSCQVQHNYPETAIAIVGAACKYPGADTLDQLWDIISTGQVMHQKVPHARFNTKSSWRDPPNAPGMTGNFVSGVDQFDYALFGISPREATYMDPQQRIALKVAYQAVESSGYFGHGIPETDVGCYVGVGGSDYEHNVNSHTPTAFSFIGTSRAFVSGRISHYFKWTGPSIAIDTACSSSAVAIHQACRDIVSGDCTMALAGGVNVMSSPHTYQNLAAAGMVNSTGPCRSFDSDASGYSRGEGCGFIVLKRLSAAVADGDSIMGVIAATATNQSNGTSSITVPVSKSQAALYRRALCRADMSPGDISYVEAHGTGTPRGDPIEYQSIREVFSRGANRKEHEHKVHIGSIKSNIGHTEAASGVAGVLKVLMMIQRGQIPPQANFSSLNPAIQHHESDNMDISTKGQQWASDFRAACINNYGAAGNNTAIIVCQPPKRVPGEISVPTPAPDEMQIPPRYPFLISAQSETGLQRYCAALARFLETKSPSLRDVAFHVAQHQNRSLRHRIAFGVTSLTELLDCLKHHAQIGAGISPALTKGKARPVVLVFGGQTGSTVRLSRVAYDASYPLRRRADECDVLVQEMGLPSLFPRIFDQTPVLDVVSLHCLLFTVQYACAKAWLDAGLSVQRVIGHSFGQLTAMCIAGVITLSDALKLVAGRAGLIKHQWGEEKGSMLAVEIDRAGAHSLVGSELDGSIEIACYNGLNTHVLVGSEAAIQNVESKLSDIPSRRLNTTHGFHSQFVNPLMDKFLELAMSISYGTPIIPIETCSETSSWSVFTPELVAEHSRQPVYFYDAVNRVQQDLGPCIWLEGGSGSSGVMLAKQALEENGSSSFYGLQLGSSNPFGSVVNTNLQLWAEGVNVRSWLYHPQEAPRHSEISLPGYQFDESSHWLACVESTPTTGSSEEEQVLISLATLSCPEPHVSSFELDQRNPLMGHILKGREVLGGTLWPLSLYVELVARGAALLAPGLPPAFHLARLVDVEIKVPLGSKCVDGLSLRLKQLEAWTWEFSIESQGSTYRTRHATGTVTIEDQRPSNIVQEEVAPKVIDYQRCLTLLDDLAPAFAAPGSIAYKLLEKVAEYDPQYQGIKSIKMNEQEATARVDTPAEARDYAGKTSCNPILVDQFTLIAEIHALTMENCKRSEVFACSGLGKVTIFPGFHAATVPAWVVYTKQTAKQDREVFYDTFVFDPDTEQLVMAVLGARFIKTSGHTLQRIVVLANLDEVDMTPERTDISRLSQLSSSPERGDPPAIWQTTADIVHELTGFPAAQISAKTVLADIGMDSLATTELESKIREIFQVDIPGRAIDLSGDFETLCDTIHAHKAPALVGAPSMHRVTTSSSGSSARFTPTSGSSSPRSERESQSTSPSMARLLGMVAEHLGSAEQVLPASQLHSLGLDSLVTLELESELLGVFGSKVNLMQLDHTVTISDLHSLVVRSCQTAERAEGREFSLCAPAISTAQPIHFIDQAATRFHLASEGIGSCAREAGFAGFFTQVSPKQTSLVLAYVVQALSTLGCDLYSIPPGTSVPLVPHLPKHSKVVTYYYNFLIETGLISSTSTGFIRTSKALNLLDPSKLHDEILSEFPQHRSEHLLLHRTGSRLANCLSGADDPLRLLFHDKSTGDLLQDVYTNAPMFKMGTLMLGHFLDQALPRSTSPSSPPLRILELGAGTGGTTKYVLERLIASGVSFRYAFTDISSMLVSRARNTFSAYDCLDYMTLDIERVPEELKQSFDLIISSNCIHATKDLRVSCRAIHELLKPKGMLCLLELTRDLPWLDCTFGLLDGWWRFEDGRKHVLASEQLWRELLTEAGFGHVDWTKDGTREADVFRLIMALKQST